MPEQTAKQQRRWVRDMEDPEKRATFERWLEGEEARRAEQEYQNMLAERQYEELLARGSVMPVIAFDLF